MKVKFKRSMKWVQAQQIETGKNVDIFQIVEVDPSQLSQPARVAVLKGRNEYPVIIDGIGKNYCSQRVEFKLDSENPTVEQLDQMIVQAGVDYQLKLDKLAEEKEEKLAAEQRLADARELLSDELRDFQIQIDWLSEKVVRMTERRDVLQTLLREVDLDPLNEAVERIVARRRAEGCKEYRQSIEDCASVYIFDRD